MLNLFRPSEVSKPLWDTPWQNSERETIATNILKLSRHGNGDQWKPFTWEEYVEYCAHDVTEAERRILDDFVETGYLSKDQSGKYHFENRIIGVYMMYTD